MHRFNYPNTVDFECLRKLWREPQFNPFSFKFSAQSTEQLRKESIAKGVSNNIINIISLGSYFNETFHKPIVSELENHVQKTQLPKSELIQLFIGLINEQQFLNEEKYKKFLDNVEYMSAFDIQNAVMIKEENPENPQNFTMISETLVEFANIFLRYLAHLPDNEQNIAKAKPDEELLEIIVDIIQICNKYYGIKGCYDGCILANGSIVKNEDGSLNFDPGSDDLLLLERIGTTMIENQRFNRLNYYESGFNEKGEPTEIPYSNKPFPILDIVWIEEGQIKYSLRERTESDHKNPLNYLISLHDYYPFYEDKPLQKFHNLTITNLLHIHGELNLMVTALFQLGLFKKVITDIKLFKNYLTPKISCENLQEYLVTVTGYTEEQIKIFLNILTTKHITNLNLYATHLLKVDECYYFNLIPPLRPNYLYLIDYWLKVAGEDLGKRGKVFEKHIKDMLKAPRLDKINFFNVLDKTKFKTPEGEKEEIDLIIETKQTIVVGEIKCVQYPMYAEDECEILNETIYKAVMQLKRKCDYIGKNMEHFFPDNSSDRIIVPVVILNFPVYVSLIVDGIPVIDANSLSSYFRSGQMVTYAFGNHEKEVHSIKSYYESEDEFCIHFIYYLASNPMIEEYISMLEIKEACNIIPDMPIFRTKTIVPRSEESLLRVNRENRRE